MKYKLKNANKKLVLKSRLAATIPFDEKTAKRAMSMKYYKAQNNNMKHYVYIEEEKLRLTTPKWVAVTHILEEYKERGYSKKSTVGKVLKGIYEKNKMIVLGKAPFSKTTNILQIVAKTETLLLAYKRIKKNKGAMTKAASVDIKTLQGYDDLQKGIYYRKRIFPDGFSLRDVETAGYLLLKGKYPWGSSKRIWLDKPGSAKKRPITIPPFLDRVVQEAIKMVLYAIWEPDFERMNRSFGFRPNKACHDAICALKSNYACGLFRAIEGDIQGAYDNVDKKILIQQLSKKIQDKGFLEMMLQRLSYDYVDETTKKRVQPKLGIPQGGIDSPYLFNIYLHDLDVFVKKDLNEYLEQLNLKAGVPAGRVAKALNMRRNFHDKMTRRKNNLSILKKLLRKDNHNPMAIRNKLFSDIKGIRLMNHKLRNIPYFDPNKRRLRLFYVRYADDWIILSNVNSQIAEILKTKVKDFLQNTLKATLSEEKTLITDIRRNSAHFLGL